MLTRKELYNIPGWHTKRHLVVIESDDWGSIRMPSREVYDEFLRRGIRVDRDPYCRYDRLESREDMSRLFEVLLLDTSLDEVYWPCSHSRAIPGFPSQLEWKIGLAWANTRGILNSPS